MSTQTQELAKLIVNSRHRVSRPYKEPGKRLVGYVISNEYHPSDSLFALQHISDVFSSHDRLTDEVGRLREALKPFTHPDFRKVMSNNVGGADSPIFGREDAILTLGDFERAAKALNPRGAEMNEFPQTWYVTQMWLWPSIISVVVERATDKCVWVKGRRHPRISSYESYYPTWGAAYQDLVRLQTEKVNGYRNQFQVAERKLADLKGMKKPEEST
jgi:hypothetical protein